MARSSAGAEAVELAAAAGLILDPWQELVLEGALGERSDGRWAASEVGLVVPRQNGKGAVLEARELAGLFLFGERLILHSAHEFKTAKEAYERVCGLIKDTPDLARLVKQYRFSNEEVSIELTDRRKLRFIARSTGSGRGFSADTIILDEAYKLPSSAISALMPTLAARPNPQIWYTSSAPLPNMDSDTLRRVCKRGRSGGEHRLAYFEWCASEDSEPDDPESWADANPGLGFRIDEESIERELVAMEPEDFDRERRGIWPETINAEPAINPEDWRSDYNPYSTANNPVVLAFDVSTDNRWSVIAAAGVSSQGGTHVEVIESRRSTGWVVGRLVELRDSHQPAAIVCNPGGPAGALLAACEKAGLEVETMSGRDYTAACGAAYIDITEGRWCHIDQPELNAAVTGAAKRQVGDAWVFDRRGSIDISPLTAVTMAAWLAGKPPEENPEVGFFTYADLVAD